MNADEWLRSVKKWVHTAMLDDVAEHFNRMFHEVILNNDLGDLIDR